MLDGNSQGIVTCAFSTSGKRLACGSSFSDEGKVRVINLETGNSIKTDDLDLGDSLVSALYFSGDEHLIIGCSNGEMIVYDIDTHKSKIYVHDVPVMRESWSFCADSNRGACGGENGMITLIDLTTCQPLKSLHFGESVNCLSYDSKVITRITIKIKFGGDKI